MPSKSKTSQYFFHRANQQFRSKLKAYDWYISANLIALIQKKKHLYTIKCVFIAVLGTE